MREREREGGGGGRDGGRKRVGGGGEREETYSPRFVSRLLNVPPTDKVFLMARSALTIESAATLR